MVLFQTLGKHMLLQVTKLLKFPNLIIGIVEFELAKLCFCLWQYYASSHNFYSYIRLLTPNFLLKSSYNDRCSKDTEFAINILQFNFLNKYLQNSLVAILSNQLLN